MIRAPALAPNGSFQPRSPAGNSSPVLGLFRSLSKGVK